MHGAINVHRKEGNAIFLDAPEIQIKNGQYSGCEARLSDILRNLNSQLNMKLANVAFLCSA